MSCKSINDSMWLLSLIAQLGVTCMCGAGMSLASSDFLLKLCEPAKGRRELKEVSILSISWQLCHHLDCYTTVTRLCFCNGVPSQYIQICRHSIEVYCKLLAWKIIIGWKRIPPSRSLEDGILHSAFFLKISSLQINVFSCPLGG